MRIALSCMLVFILGACQNFSGPEQVNDFSFFDTSGNRYRVSTVGAELKDQYSSLKSPIIITVLTQPDIENSKLFWEQNTILRNFDAETYQYIYIIGSVEEPFTSGYHLTPETTKQLLGQEKFKILIFNRSAKLVVEQNAVITYEEVKHHLDAMQ